jgi:hypothetical protein
MKARSPDFLVPLENEGETKKGRLIAEKLPGMK